MNRSILITIIVIVVLIIAGIVGLIILSSPWGKVSDCADPEEICIKFPFDTVPNCQEDSFNCDYFDTQEGAQWLYDYCIERDAGDVHGLDNDGDGVVCEGLG